MAVSPILRIGLICGVALAAGAGGVLGLRYLRHANTQVAAAAPGPSAADAMPEPAAEPDVPLLHFRPAMQRYSLTQDGAAYYAPSLQGPTLYPLKTGTPLVSTSISDDGAWVIALTADGQSAFLPVSELGAFDPSTDPLAAAAATGGAPDDAAAGQATDAEKAAVPISGVAQVVDTATLSVGGQSIPLAGVKGLGGKLAIQLGQGIAAHGGTVTCTPRSGGSTYLCTLRDGVDVARLALFNGLAQPTDDASADYRQQADAAHAAQRGIWQ